MDFLFPALLFYRVSMLEIIFSDHLGPGLND